MFTCMILHSERLHVSFCMWKCASVCVRVCPSMCVSMCEHVCMLVRERVLCVCMSESVFILGYVYTEPGLPETFLDQVPFFIASTRSRVNKNLCSRENAGAERLNPL